MSDFSLDHPQVLHLLWALPLLAMFYLWGFAKKSDALERFASLHLLGTLLPAVSLGRQRFKAILILAAAGLIVLALTGPRWGKYYVEVPSRGIDLMFVLDVSNSMRAEDIVPNRLERAKLDIKDMLEILEGDQVGLITFAGKSTVACPLTNNYGSFLNALERVTTRSAPRGGTNLGDAVRHAAASFTDRVKDHKAILLISDGGETDASYAVEAAQKTYEERGIRVFCVGVGDMVEGGRIPIMKGGQKVYMTFQNQVVWTKLEPQLMQEMAAVADGGYFANTDFREIYDRIRPKVAPREFETNRREMKHARFHWFAGAALALLMIETLMTDRRTR